MKKIIDVKESGVKEEEKKKYSEIIGFDEIYKLEFLIRDGYINYSSRRNSYRLPILGIDEYVDIVLSKVLDYIGRLGCEYKLMVEIGESLDDSIERLKNKKGEKNEIR